MKGISAKFLLALPFLCLLSGCGGNLAHDETGIIRIGNGGEPRDLDPHAVTGLPEVKIINCLLEGLVAYHPTDDSIPYPGAARRWEVSEDGRTWRFFLREEGRWSNGDPVTAHDFVYAWRRVLIPELGNEYADWMYVIKGAEAWHKGESDDIETFGVYADSDYILRIELIEPVADFLKVLLNHTFLPVHPPTIEAHGGPGLRQSGWTRPESYVGNGAYRLVKWEPDSVIRIEPNPFYWDAEGVLNQGMEFYPISDENTELRAFESGQLHITNSCPVNMRGYYEERYPERIRFDPYAGVYFYRFNTTRPPLDDIRVRRALAMAIDRQQIVSKLLKGRERVATTYVPAGIGGYQPDPRPGYDPDQARELLAQAGYPGGEGFPVVEVLFNTSDNHRKIAEAIQNMWRSELGIDVSLTNKEWKVYLNVTQNLQYDISRAGWIGNLYAYSFLRTLLSYSPNNETGFADPEFDRLVETSMHTLDTEDNHKLIREAENRLLDFQPVAPLYWYTNIYLIDSRVRNWNPKLLDQRPMKLVYLEE